MPIKNVTSGELKIKSRLEPKLNAKGEGRLTFAGIEFDQNGSTHELFPVLLFRLRATTKGKYIKMRIASSTTTADNTTPNQLLSPLCSFGKITGFSFSDPETIQESGDDEDDWEDEFAFEVEDNAEEIFNDLLEHCENLKGRVYKAPIKYSDKPSGNIKNPIIFEMLDLQPMTRKGEPLVDVLD